MFNLEDKSPFYKNISDINAEDIQNLIFNQVSEGWYIEYKSQFPNKNSKIANSLASFANSNGGWYIVGIKEKDGESYADEIVGLNSDEINRAKEKIASIVRDHIHPTPLFESKIVEIEENKFVLIVYVAEGKDAPYITGGSIYQRVGEVSNPKPLSDRYFLEKLMDRKKEFDLKIDNFCRNEFINSSNFKQPFIEFYIYLDNGNFFFDNFITPEFMAKLKDNFNNEVNILSENVNVTANIEFPNISSSYNSYILRNIDSFRTTNIGCAIEVFNNGNFKFILPFNMIDTTQINDEYLQFYDDNLKICDITTSMLIFVTVINQYIRLLKNYEYTGNFYVRLNLKNCLRMSPYFENDSFKKEIIDNDIPISFKSKIIMKFDIEQQIFNMKTIKAELFLYEIIKAIGISPKLFDAFAEDLTRKITENDL